MTLKIQHKRSAVKGKQPLPTDLEFGEIAVNYEASSPAIYIKDSAGVIRRIGSQPGALVFRGSSAPTAKAPTAPQAGDVYMMTADGIMAASWVGMAGRAVVKSENIAWTGTEWESLGSNTVTDATTTAKGIVQLADAAAITAGTAGRVVDAAQLKAAVAVENLWNRTGTTLTTTTAGDKVAAAALPAATTAAAGAVQLADAAAVTAGTAGRVVDAAQLKAAVAAEDLWDRTGTTLKTKTAGDKVDAAALPAATTAVVGAVQLADAAAITAGTAGRVVDAAQLNTAIKNSGQLTLSTAVTAAGRSVDFINIPSGVKRVTLMWNHVSLGTNGNPWLVQLGTSGGIETTGYASSSNEFTGGGVGADNSTAGFVMRNNNENYIYTGQMVITNMTGDTWVESGIFASPQTVYTTTTAGVKTLSGALTQLRITTVSGAYSFDSGTFNIMYEG